MLSLCTHYVPHLTVNQLTPHLSSKSVRNTSATQTLHVLQLSIKQILVDGFWSTKFEQHLLPVDCHIGGQHVLNSYCILFNKFNLYTLFFCVSIYYSFSGKKYFLKAPIIHNCKNLASKGNNSLRKYAIQKLSIMKKNWIRDTIQKKNRQLLHT